LAVAWLALSRGTTAVTRDHAGRAVRQVCATVVEPLPARYPPSLSVDRWRAAVWSGPSPPGKRAALPGAGSTPRLRLGRARVRRTTVGRIDLFGLEEGIVMSRRLVAVAALTLGLMVATAAPALAQEVIPGGGNAFGQHVAGMAPEHAIQHGAEFGACISAMARGLDCPHNHH
jgi:hypothetical protein